MGLIPVVHRGGMPRLCWEMSMGFLEGVKAKPRPEGNKSGLEVESWEAPTVICHRASGCDRRGQVRLGPKQQLKSKRLAPGARKGLALWNVSGD